MKKLFTYIFLGFVLVGCKTVEQPKEVYIPRKDINTLELVKYKNDLSNHQIVVGLHYGWGDKPGYNLINTPNYLDMIILKNNYFSNAMNPFLRKDLNDVQNLKGTRVLVSFDFYELEHKALKEYRTKSKALKKQFEAELRDKEVNISAKEKRDSLAIIDQRVRSEVTSMVRDYIDFAIANLPKLVSNIGYNGISVRFSADSAFVGKQRQIESSKLWADFIGKNKNQGSKFNPLFVVENPIADFADQINLADFIIYGKDNNLKLKDIEETANTWSKSRFIPSVNMTDAKFAKPYEDSKVFYPEGKVDKAKELIYWKSDNKAGLAIYHTEKYYYEVGSYESYVDTYVGLKEMIVEVANVK